jgi:hypothetical protein
MGGSPANRYGGRFPPAPLPVWRRWWRGQRCQSSGRGHRIRWGTERGSFGSVAVDSIVAGRGQDPSDSVEEVCQCLIVFCFGLEGPPVDGSGIRGIQTSGSNVPAVLLIVSHFNQGCDVGVEGGHLVSVRLVCFSLQGQGSRSR